MHPFGSAIDLCSACRSGQCRGPEQSRPYEADSERKMDRYTERLRRLSYMHIYMCTGQMLLPLGMSPERSRQGQGGARARAREIVMRTSGVARFCATKHISRLQCRRKSGAASSRHFLGAQRNGNSFLAENMRHEQTNNEQSTFGINHSQSSKCDRQTVGQIRSCTIASLLLRARRPAQAAFGTAVAGQTAAG